jgi:hypothetical protein
MQTKLQTLKDAAAAQNWQGALRIAAKFADLGEHKAAIVRGHEAHSNARFAVQLGRDPAADIEAGIQALCARYSLNRDGTENTARAYGRKDNCIRAARKVLGADAQPGKDFALAQTEAGWVWTAWADALQAADAAVDAVLADQPAGQPVDWKAVETQARAALAAPAAEAPAPAYRGRYTAMATEAARGVLPAVPDFSAETHKAYRKRLAQVVAYVEAGDLAGLQAFPLKVTGSSSKALARYINMAAAALAAVSGSAVL